MTGRPLAAFAIVLSTIFVSVVAQEPPPTFRSSAGVVRVDVSVQNGGRPVTNLTAADFGLYDDGLPQRISDVSYGRLPIDVTVALDVSKSVTGQLLTALRRSVDDLQGRLKEGDRMKLIAFNYRVRRVLDFAGPGADTRTAFTGLMSGGGTALNDVIAVALASPAPAGRRQLIIVFTDGVDTSSVGDPNGLFELAQRTTPTLAFVGPFRVIGGVARMTGRSDVAPFGNGVIGAAPINRLTTPAVEGASTASTLYRDLAAETGGAVVSLPGEPGANLVGTFGRILDDFRSSYVLHFAPDAAGRKGFHTLDVKILRPGSFDVVARRGYVKE